MKTQIKKSDSKKMPHAKPAVKNQDAPKRVNAKGFPVLDTAGGEMPDANYRETKPVKGGSAEDARSAFKK